MPDDELTAEEEGLLDEEIAHASAILDGENAARDRQLEAEVFGPDDTLKTFLGDAQAKPIEDWGGDGAPEEGVTEFARPPDTATQDQVDEHEYRLGMLEDPDEEPELLSSEPPWRWAILTADWVAGENTIEANPCLEAGVDPDTDTTLTLYCTLPLDASPNWVALATDDVVAYLPFYDSENEEIRGVIIGTSHAGTATTPAAILPAAFETEAAQADTWDRAAPAEGKDGVAIIWQTRMAYADDGDELLYAYHRTVTFDSSGKLTTISAETRVTVDTPEACP